MNQWEADGIAEKLAHSWPHSSVTASSWAEELKDLDKGRAEQATRQLVRSAERAPSIAQFLATYRNLAGTIQSDFTCPDCANSGWVTCTDHPNHWPGKHPTREQVNGVWRTTLGDVPAIPDWYSRDDGCCCNVVKPCRCEHGAKARKQRTRSDEPL